MRLQRINDAEAIIEPFFDGSDSSRPHNKISQLTHYDIKRSDPDAVTAEQDWCGVRVFMHAGAKRSVEMTRACDLDISDFDIFRVFGTAAASVCQTIRAKIDGAWTTLCDREPGPDATVERDYPIHGRKLEALTLILESDGEKDCGAQYLWLGLSNAQRQAEMEARKSVFTPDWPDMLVEDGAFEPQIGVMFGKEDVEALRARVHSGALKPLYDAFLKKTEEYLTWEPEKDIGTYIPHPDSRWTAKRDLGRKDTSYQMGALAFAGLIEKRADMMKMAVRMALSAAHCEYWTESIMGVLPGCGWHHRSFTEEVYCRGCAQVLDWAGGFLTPYAREILVDAIAMKGLPRIESDFKRQEYIRGMNQGIVFSSGRVFGLMACAHFYPRYGAQVLEAERDLKEMIGNYIMADGGTPEGPSYWAYTFGQVMPILYLLSRFHKEPFGSMLTPALEKTGRYALSLLSDTGDGAAAISLNDAHHGTRYSADLMASFYALTGDEAYLRLAAVNLQHSAGTPYLFIIVPDSLPAPEPFVQEGFFSFPAIGQTRIIRKSEDFGRTSLSFFCGLADVGHFHMDKGSVVLQAAGEELLVDRGVLGYDHPDTLLCGMPEYHNLLMPELSGARPRQKPTRDGAYLVSAQYESGAFTAEGDVTKAWNDGRILKDTRRIESGCPEIFTLVDDMVLSESAPVSALFNTVCPCEKTESGAVIHGEKADLVIEAVGWAPEILCAPFGVDCTEKPVNRIALRSAAKTEHHLTTRLTLVKK